MKKKTVLHKKTPRPFSPGTSRGMVDISAKQVTRRSASASAKIVFTRKAFDAFLREGSPKGDVLETAKTAGIFAAKKTPDMIPMCHPLLLQGVDVTFEINNASLSISVYARVLSEGKTGVEMEALHAAVTAALTVYDMMKYADKGIRIEDVRLLEKKGGKSGDYQHKEIRGKSAK